MVITIAKAYKRGGNVACVTAADMFLTEVSSIISGYSFSDTGYPVLTDASGSIIIHRSEELMPYVDGSGSEHYTSYSDTISAVSGEKTEDGVTSRTLKDYDGTSRFVISDVIPSAGWTLSYAMDSSELYKDAHNIIIIFAVIIPVIIALGAFICVLVIKRCFRPLAPIKDSLSDIRTFLSGVFSEISEAAGAVYSGANNVYQGANELAESASRQTAVVEEISGCVSAANSMISESSGLAAGRPRLSAKLPPL